MGLTTSLHRDGCTGIHRWLPDHVHVDEGHVPIPRRWDEAIRRGVPHVPVHEGGGSRVHRRLELHLLVLLVPRGQEHEVLVVVGVAGLLLQVQQARWGAVIRVFGAGGLRGELGVHKVLLARDGQCVQLLVRWMQISVPRDGNMLSLFRHCHDDVPMGFEMLYARQFTVLPFPLGNFEAGVLDSIVVHRSTTEVVVNADNLVRGKVTMDIMDGI
mmetsp:Transcript_25546/g.43522  ORF Transcript_25546/g.43522 Transcript_25546/m.43522 type:complete len:214 (-) Transcript_25546:212-853(-)